MIRHKENYKYSKKVSKFKSYREENILDVVAQALIAAAVTEALTVTAGTVADALFVAWHRSVQKMQEMN